MGQKSPANGDFNLGGPALERTRRPALPPATIDDLDLELTDETRAGLATARELVRNSRAQSTQDTYLRAWRSFLAWAATEHPNVTPFPAPPGLVGLYVGVLRNRGLASQTIHRITAAIAHHHRAAGLPSPTLDPMLREELAGLRRAPKTETGERNALTREQCTEILLRLGTPATLLELRDRAIFTLAWCTALRRSNIAMLDVRDVALEFDPIDETRYVRVRVRKSKTDQEGRGRDVVVTELPGDHPLCAYRSLRAYLDATNLSAGALFRTFTLARRADQRRLTENRIDAKDVARTVKRLVRLSGMDDGLFAAHSLRRGFATSADAAGVRRSLIREQGGWADDRMLAVYTKHEAVRDNAVREMFKP